MITQKNLFVPPSPQGTVVSPGPLGAVSWPPTAYDGHLAYLQVRHGATTYTVNSVPAGPGRPEIRYTETGIRQGRAVLQHAHRRRPERRGRIAWSDAVREPPVRRHPRHRGRPRLLRRGGWHLDAHDAATGQILWRFQCGAGISGPAMTYALDGKQYVAVAAGGASFTQSSGFGTGDSLVVFALPD